VSGLDNNSKLLNNKLEALIMGLNNQTRLLNEKLDVLITVCAHQSQTSSGDGTVSDKMTDRRSAS
jgi:hypothetical protein